jgi:hypothetical protein
MKMIFRQDFQDSVDYFPVGCLKLCQNILPN